MIDIINVKTKFGIDASDVYSIVDFAVEMSKEDSGRHNTVIFKVAFTDAYALKMFPEINDKVSGKDIFEAFQWLGDNGYLEKVQNDEDAYKNIYMMACDELQSIESYETSTGVVIQSFMDFINQTLEGLSDKADVNIANEDIQSVLNIAQKYGMK